MDNQTSSGAQEGYDTMRKNQPEETGVNMGGGEGAHGSGVAGGYEGGAQPQKQLEAAGEKQDWLDKGISSAGKKLGFNVSASNADKAGDFANKEAKQYGGRNIPGVQ